MTHQSHSWGYTQRNVTQVTPEALAHPFLLQRYSLGLLGKSQGAPLLTNGVRKCGTYTKWSFTQQWRRMKSYHSQVNGWNWRTSFWVRFTRLRRPKIVCSPSYVVFRSRANTTMLLDFGHTVRGEHIQEVWGIGRKPKTWKCLMSPLQRS
jgi:hypothetical protein